jgi:uncharacterized MAPEG superfamily protein
VQTIVFIVIWTSIHRHVTSHGPLRLASRITKFHNNVYETFHIFLPILIIQSPSHNDQPARRIYHFTKTYKYLDILTVCASGAPIAPHFAVHHLTTPYLTLCRVLYNSEGWKVGAILNVFHHVLMYAYFGGMQRVRRLLPVTGTVQLVGLLVEGILARNKLMDGRAVWPNMMAMGLGMAYLCLFVSELRQGKDDQEKLKAG